MEKTRKKMVRVQFRTAVFQRDLYQCRFCHRYGKDRQGGIVHRKFHQQPESQLVLLDAHHITDRHCVLHGGYIKENGISLCEECHQKAESHWLGNNPELGYSPDDLYQLIGSSYELACQILEKS